MNNREIGDTSWDTPEWCPFRAEAIRKGLAMLEPEKAKIEVPDERFEPQDWGEVPMWAKCYIELMENELGGARDAGKEGESHD